MASSLILNENRQINLRQLSKKLIEILVVALLYMGATRIGYALAFLDTIVSPVWPPAGVALAALLLCGYHTFFGVFLGAALGSFLNFSDLSLAAGNGTASAIGRDLLISSSSISAVP